jgi:single-stranded-DNA-specific exonuclease
MHFRGTKYEWILDPVDDGRVREIVRATGVSPTLARVLASRNVSSGGEAALFLRADARLLPDAHLLPDALRAVERVGEALARGERIAVHGHDDADGVAATVIMVEALSQLGAAVSFYIPDRSTEGHGLNRREIDRHSAAGVRLIVTVDSCVSDRDHIHYAAELGIDTIVTDHHEIPPVLPPAYAIVNPKLPHSPYPYRTMAGVGVSLRIADLLLGELSPRFAGVAEDRPWYGPRWFEEAIALAAIGSVADKVPLTGDNRTIVAEGLRAIPGTERPGLRAILEESQLWGRELEPDDIQESIAPIFGRVSDGEGGNEALAMLLTPDPAEALARARSLAGARLRWRESATAAWRRIQGVLGKSVPAADSHVVIVEAQIPIDVMGYVTSRVAEETALPTIIVVKKNGQSMAEARGPRGFNFVLAMNTMAELFLGYGGHPRAAGFSIANENLAAFRERMTAYASANPPELRPRPLDAELPLREATPPVALELERLRPYGLGNGPAELLARDVTARELEAARASGLRFGRPLRFDRLPVDLAYRLHHSDGVAFATIIDTIEETEPPEVRPHDAPS